VEPEPEVDAEAEVADESDLLRDVAARLMIYVHPAAAKTLKRYALEQSAHKATVRVHDLVIEALEIFFEKNGLPGPVRAKEPPAKPAPKKRRS
jgi:hypothetical protein